MHIRHCRNLGWKDQIDLSVTATFLIFALGSALIGVWCFQNQASAKLGILPDLMEALLQLGKTPLTWTDVGVDKGCEDLAADCAGARGGQGLLGKLKHLLGGGGGVVWAHMDVVNTLQWFFSVARPWTCRF